MTAQLSPKELANQNKQKNQSHFSLSESTTTTVFTYPPKSTGESQKLPLSPTLELHFTSSPPRSIHPSSQVRGAENASMRFGSKSFSNSWNLYKKNHPNVHFLFPIRDKTKDALSQNTLPNPQQSLKPSSNFVNLPFEPWNTKLKVEIRSGARTQVKKWEIIGLELAKLKSVISSGDCGGKLRQAVLNYNKKKGAESYNLLNQTEISNQLIRLFDFLASEAVKIAHIFPRGILILRKNVSAQVFINQEQILSILANAFLCTFPETCGTQLPEINFNELFTASLHSNEAEIKTQKLKCILHYFNRIQQGISGGHGSVLSFERRSLREDKEPNWEHSGAKLFSVKIVNDGQCIENAENCLQVDFANQFVGGGVLGRGMVMEEIRFSICPELIAARLFTEKLEKNEVLIVTGCEQFSKYSGYGSTFKYDGDYQDKTELDDLGRKKTKIVAMDAYNFSSDSRKQYGPDFVKRELNKSYIAFYEEKEADRSSIATGHWGCGVFGGDYQLKFLLQWMAASQTKRQMNYYTDPERGRELRHIATFLKNKNPDIGKLWCGIKRYNENQIEAGYKHPKTLLIFLESSYF